MKIVECPICGAKYDISRVPNGTKLKCANCKKIFGIVQDGELTPFLETDVPVSALASAPESTSEPAEEEDLGFEEVESEYADEAEQVATEPVEKPGFLLVIGGLVGLVAMGALAYTLYAISQPLPAYEPSKTDFDRLPPPVEKSPPPIEKKEIKSPAEDTRKEGLNNEMELPKEKIKETSGLPESTGETKEPVLPEGTTEEPAVEDKTSEERLLPE